MSEDTTLVDEELETLKAEAEDLGVNFHPNIKAATLKEKIAAFKADEAAKQAEIEAKAQELAQAQLQEQVALMQPAPVEAAPAPEEPAIPMVPTSNMAHVPAAKQAKAGANPNAGKSRDEIFKEALKLVRVRINCMNPNKREQEGEFFCAGNSIVPTQKKYVPYDTEWHVPNIVLQVIKDRKCQVFYTERDSRGNPIRRGKTIKEFAVEILPPLTEAELKELERRQAMQRGETA